MNKTSLNKKKWLNCHTKLLRIIKIATLFLFLFNLSSVAEPSFTPLELKNADEIEIKGIVTDKNGEPLIGVSIVSLSNPNTGTITGTNGEYTIKLSSPNEKIRFNYLGYVAQEVVPGNLRQINIRMEESTKALDEVVVVAFGKMAREAFTGSAGVLKSEDILKAQVTDPTQVLAGRVAGLQLNNSSSQFGSAPSITIRGFSSISSDTEPLYIVDGAPYDGDLSLINSADIESITVLKDAASNALYGARGANGVIMITTNKGKRGDTKINFNSRWGYNSNGEQYYKTMNSQQFYETYYKMLYDYYLTEKGGSMSATDAHALANNNLVNPGAGVGPGYMVYSVPNGQDFIQSGGKMNPNATLGTLYSYQNHKFWLQPDDWAKEGLQNGFRQEYNLSLSGASDRINYYTSLGYLGQDGIQKGQEQSRLTARMKVDYFAKKWLRAGGNFNYTKYDYSQTAEGTIGGGSLWPIIRNTAPIYPVYFRGEDKKIMIDKWGEPMYDFANRYDLSKAGGVGGNAIFNNKYEESGSKGNSFNVSGYADVLFTEDLTFTFNASAYNYDQKYFYRTSPFVDYYTSSSNNGYLYKSTSGTYSYNTQQLLNYVKRFNRHEVTALLGHEYYNLKSEWLNASGYNFGIEDAYELAATLNKNNNPNSASSVYNVEGYFFRGMYNYDAKYYASLSYRRDASSRFHKEHRWGDFWSVGGAWIISKENFFNAPWVNSLKYKLSVGSQGNDGIGNYLYANSYKIVNSGDEVAFQWRQKGSEGITWETNTNWNTGFEFELLKGRLNGSLDYFYRKTTDMLFSLKTPPSIGYTSYMTNMGDMRNSGLELALNANVMNRGNFSWDVNFNISYVKNKVLRLPDDVKKTKVEGYDGYVNLDNSFVSKYQYFVGEGLPLYTWYHYKFAGLDEETGESLYYKDVLDEAGKVVDKETTKDAAQATRYLLGDAAPHFFGGLGTTFNFRGFDLSINTNFQIGGKVFDYNYQTLMHAAGRTATNWHVDMLNAWTPENKNTDVPRLLFSHTYSQTANSDRFLVNASQLNIQNINFGYTLPEKLTRSFDIQTLRVYLSGENLCYFSARKGLDSRQRLTGYVNPEMAPVLRIISGGISLTF